MVLSENLGIADSRITTDAPLLPPQKATPTGHIAIDVFVGGEQQTATDSFVENLIQAFVTKHGTKPIIDAKEEFFKHGGKIFAEDDNYHQRIYYFLNHFIFERPLNTFSRSTPFLEHLEAKPEASDIEGFTHSLFKILKIRPDHLMLKDLFSEKKLRVDRQDLEVFEGISKDDVFQGILLHRGAFTNLSRGLIFHPPRAHKIIASLLKQEKKIQRFGKDQILFALARLQLKHTRLKHVDPKVVYQENILQTSML
ncbi:MAG: hypothetical protein H7249_18555 [Chitinophagaceae bacterium]|nr:hypothetical protein [Oligoflexus sp.]